MKLVSNRAAAVGFCLLAGLLPGCLNDDGDSSDDAAAVAEADGVIAEGTASNAVDLLVSMVDEFPQWSAGEFAPSLARETVVTWNSETSTYTIHSLEEYEDGNVNGVADFTITVQFRAEGIPVEIPSESVDEMEIHLDGTNIGFYTGDRFTIEYDWGVGFDLLVTRIEDGSKQFDGEGVIEGSTVTEVRNRQTIRTQELGWEFALTLPPQSSCATGTLAGTLNDTYTLDAEFLGEGVVSWNIERNGVEVASNDTIYSCGVYEPVW
jgi:hypothetical protein